MVAYEFEEDYRLIGKGNSEDTSEVKDQVDFENSMESLDEMVEEGDIDVEKLPY